jgi:isoleucyl-tRNA synthetase
MKHPPAALIDRWILTLSQKLVCDVTQALDHYLLDQAIDPMVHMIDQLTNWYIRRNRSRFWADENSLDRREAFETLYAVLLNLVKTAAPFIPFLSDAIYRQLRTHAMPESVHLCDFPIADPSYNQELLDEVEAAQRAVSLGHSIRKEYKLKVRQPLMKAHLITSNLELLNALKKQSQVIADELNVKSIEFHDEEGAFVQWMVKPNFPVLGKKIGKLMPLVQKMMQNFDRKQLKLLAEGRSVTIQVNGETIELTNEDVQIERKVKEKLAAGNEGELTVALDTTLNDELLEEGLAREIVNKINTMRRDMGFEVTDRITIRLKTTPRVKSCFERFGDMIRNEVLAVDIQFGEAEGSLWELNGEETIIAIEKAKA